MPAWFSIADAAASATSKAQANEPASPASTESAGSKVIWASPVALNLQAMEALRDTLGSQPMPWHLDWSQLDHVEADAMPLLAGLFSSLCNEPVSLRFTGAEQLVGTLRSMTPSGDRSAETATWEVRLNVLRTMNMQDEFELAALDYCVTYEVSPPGWQDARCHFEDVTAVINSQFGGEKGIVVTSPMGLDDGSAATVDLRGEILGDATQALAALDSSGGQGENIVISCAALVRVDFSAAGSILNWVATRQNSGFHVQFRDVHRLVAAFFNVIGINEHARVLPRSM
jgi:anti-anti-sigma regulatory factor